MYLLMLASLPCCQPVLTKYPSFQNSPPHSFFFASGQDLNISRAVMHLMICTILFGLYIGTDFTRKCTMVLVCTNLYECHLKSFADFQTALFQLLVHRRRKHHSSILRWTHDVIQKHRDIVTLMDIPAHTS